MVDDTKPTKVAWNDTGAMEGQRTADRTTRRDLFSDMLKKYAGHLR